MCYVDIILKESLSIFWSQASLGQNVGTLSSKGFHGAALMEQGPSCISAPQNFESELEDGPSCPGPQNPCDVVQLKSSAILPWPPL